MVGGRNDAFILHLLDQPGGFVITDGKLALDIRCGTFAVLDHDGYGLVIQRVFAIGVATETQNQVDAVGLSLLAKNILIMKWCADQLRSPDDVVQVFENGTSNVSGMYTAYTKAQAAFQGLMSKWGLSPVDREKIAGMLLDQEPDEYEAFKGQ